MVDHPLEPEDLTTAGLPSARRGYDRKAVGALLDEASRRWRKLRDHHDSVIDEIERRGGVENLGRDLREIGARVSSILGEAQAASEDLRQQALEEAGARLDGASEKADGLVAEADRTAFGLRKVAWEQSTEMLAQIQETIESMIEQAEADTLIIRAHAEQEAHRHLSEARREAADITRAARFEAERLVGEAKRRADELLADSTEAETAARPARSADWNVKVLGTQPARRGGDPAVEIDPHHPAYGDVLAAEVSSLRSNRPDPLPPAPLPIGDEADVMAPMEVPEPETETEPEAEPAAVAKPAAPAPVELPRPDEVGGLFDRLRRTDEIPVVVARPKPARVPEPEATPDPGPDLPARPPKGSDPIEVRDRHVLPVINEYVRIARHELLEVQNVALDEIRTLRRGATWDPDPELIGDPLREAMTPMAAAAVKAGGRGAADMGAATAAEEVPPDRALAFVDGMVDALLAAAAAAAAGEDQGAEAARMFRSWRNDEVERWVMTIGYAGYHDGLLAGLAASGVAEVVGTRHGRLCRRCPAGSGIVWDPAGAPPAGFATPPAGLDCTCAVESHS